MYRLFLRKLSSIYVMIGTMYCVRVAAAISDVISFFLWKTVTAANRGNKQM